MIHSTANIANVALSGVNGGKKNVSLAFNQSDAFSSLLQAKQTRNKLDLQQQVKRNDESMRKTEFRDQKTQSVDAKDSTKLPDKKETVKQNVIEDNADTATAPVELDVKTTQTTSLTNDIEGGQTLATADSQALQQTAAVLAMAGFSELMPQADTDLDDMSLLLSSSVNSTNFVVDTKSLNNVAEVTSRHVDKFVTDILAVNGQTGQQQARNQGSFADSGKFLNNELLSQLSVGDLGKGVSVESDTFADEFTLLQAATTVKPTVLSSATVPQLPLGLSFVDAMQSRLFAEGSQSYLSTTTGFKPIGASGTSQLFSLSTHVGQSGWGEGFNKRVAMMVSNNVQQASLRLNPQELGQIDVRITINQDQASVTFLSQHGLVREAIEAALPKLRDMLSESGINLSKVEVDSQSTSSKQQEQLAQQEEGFGNNEHSDANVDGSDREEYEDTSQSTLIRQTDTLLDYFV